MDGKMAMAIMYKFPFSKDYQKTNLQPSRKRSGHQVRSSQPIDWIPKSPILKPVTTATLDLQVYYCEFLYESRSVKRGSPEIPHFYYKSDLVNCSQMEMLIYGWFSFPSYTISTRNAQTSGSKWLWFQSFYSTFLYTFGFKQHE